MPTRRTTHILLWSLLGLAVALAVAFVALLTLPAPVERWLQGRIVLALREHYQANVTLENLQATLIPRFEASADNLVLPNRGDPDAPPLITVKHFTIDASPWELLRTPVHISHVELEGLEIKVGPKRSAIGPKPVKPKQHTHLARFVIDKVVANGTKLLILRKDPSNEPLEFDLRKLQLRSAGPNQPMAFTAELTNPTPPGLIDTQGHFGPWNFDEASATKVSGHYNFEHADLSVFDGISGILSSVGDYTGVLQNIVVDGTTDTPDFKLDRGGDAVHLTTQFHAIVDGTNGNTYLQPVNAHFLHSDVSTEGEITGRPGKKGKTITLDVDIRQARVQDILTLADKSDAPVLTGGLALKAKLDLPPGNIPVLQKMDLTGAFQVSDARFTPAKIKDAILQLSRRGQGKPKDQTIQEAPAEIGGDFALAASSLTFSKLQFVVPGALAEVKGSYALRTKAIDFTGDVRLDAHVSQTMSGPKRVLLTPFNPLFAKHGAGTYLPVSIDGSTEHPEVHLNLKKLF